MDTVVPVDKTKSSFVIKKALPVALRMHQPGPPERFDGMAVGIVTMERDAPHEREKFILMAMKYFMLFPASYA